MRIVAIRTGLFPDEMTVAAAVDRLAAQHQVECVDLARAEMDDAAWDAALAAILAADMAFTC